MGREIGGMPSQKILKLAWLESIFPAISHRNHNHKYMVIIMVIISSSFSQELLRTMRTLPADIGRYHISVKHMIL
jgi:hypothetical protein